jgi:hypothetical protein
VSTPGPEVSYLDGERWLPVMGWGTRVREKAAEELRES